MRNYLIKIQLVLILFMASFNAVAQPNPPAGKQWVAVSELTDEFNDNSLDTDKWLNYHPYWSGRSPSVYNTANVSESGGNLRLKSTVANYNKTGNWVNAACVSSKTACMKQGYYSEASIKCSNLSMTSAYWFQGKYSEIDVIENFGAPSNPSYANHNKNMKTNLHYFTPEKKDLSTPWEGSILNTSCAEKYYTYGVWWKDATTVIFYLNGNMVHTSTPATAFNEGMYMFFDTETFTWGIGLPSIESLDDPTKNTQLVDWVHTYKLATGVNVPVASVSVSPASATVAVNSTIQLTATVLPANASNKSVTWTSNNANVTVSTSGLVTGKIKGSAIITAKTVDGNKTATRTVTVTAATTITNLITNPGFETGSLSPWGSWGTVTVATSNSHSGTKAVYINGSGASEQTVTGLSPNTSYTLSGWGKVSASGQSVNLGVKEYGGSESSVQIKTTAYSQNSLTFTTGSTNTSAKIFFYVGNAAHKAYGDDFSLVKGTGTSARSAMKAENNITENTTTENKIKVYPNPIKGANCSIDFSNVDGGASVEILDLQGKSLFTQATPNSSLTISNEIFKSSGVYLIKVTTIKGVEFKKVIVQ